LPYDTSSRYGKTKVGLSTLARYTQGAKFVLVVVLVLVIEGASKASRTSTRTTTTTKRRMSLIKAISFLYDQTGHSRQVAALNTDPPAAENLQIQTEQYDLS